MSRISYVNGNYCEHKDSFVHIEDRGYQFADGVYEVFGVINKKIVDYDGHINRLFRSLNEVQINSPINKSSYYFHIKRLIKINRIDNGLIYLQITRVVAERDFKFQKNARPATAHQGNTCNSNASNKRCGLLHDEIPFQGTRGANAMLRSLHCYRACLLLRNFPTSARERACDC